MARYENYARDQNKRSHNVGLATSGKKYGKTFENATKSARLMQGVEDWCSFWRINPHLFTRDYLGITLKPFQAIWLCEMMWNNYSMFIAARGLSKTWLVSLYAIVRCILYPGTKVVVAGGTKNQALKICEKVTELKNMSKTGGIQREIKGSINSNINGDNPVISFLNGSWVRVVASNHGARSNRANLLNKIGDYIRNNIGLIGLNRWNLNLLA